MESPREQPVPKTGTAWYHAVPPAYHVAPRFGPWAMLGLVVAIVIGGQIFASGLFQFFAPTSGGRQSVSHAGLIWLLIASQTAWFALAAIVALWPRADGGAPLRRLVASAAFAAPKQGVLAYVVAALTVTVLLAVMFGLVYATGWFWLLKDLKTGAQLVNGPAWMLTLALFVVCAPLAEELLFRGLLTASLSTTVLGFWPAAMIANVLWTGLHIHYSAIGLAEIALVGIIFTALLAWSGSLRVTIFAHAVYNGLLFFIVMFLQPPV